MACGPTEREVVDIGQREGRRVPRTATLLAATGAALALLVPIGGQYGGQVLDTFLTRPRAESDGAVKVQTTATKRRRQLYAQLRTADGRLFRSEAAFRSALANHPHPRRDTFEPQVAMLRDAREAFYAAKDELSTISSTRVYCAVGRLSKAHATYTRALVEAGSAAVGGSPSDAAALEVDSRRVGKHSRAVINRMREENDLLEVPSTKDPIGCRKAFRQSAN